MATTNWLIKAYDNTGAPLTIPDMKGDAADSETVLYADDRLWSVPLNGLDMLSGKLLLADPASALINKKTTVLKMWRSISDTLNSKTLAITAGTPDFAGPVISNGIDTAGAGYRTFTAVSPLWRLNNHFHLTNHHLVTDVTPADPFLNGGNEDDLPFDASALMWYLIALINAAFHDAGGDTGIHKPPTGPPFWEKTIDISPFFVGKGSNTWSNIFDNIMNQIGVADLTPQYIHSDNNTALMYFMTAPHRGTNSVATVSFDYRTGNFNLDDIAVDESMVPGQYGNYVWAVGDGGPNVYVSDPPASDPTDMLDNGIYMKIVTLPGAYKQALDLVAPAELARGETSDEPTYQLTVHPGGPLYFNLDYFVGDLINLNAQKGYGLNVTDVAQRIYQVDLAMSKDNVETPNILVARDFIGAIPL